MLKVKCYVENCGQPSQMPESEYCILHSKPISSESPEGVRAVPREPTKAMQEAGLAAMFAEDGDLKRRELLLIVRKGWRAMYDAAPEQPKE